MTDRQVQILSSTKGLGERSFQLSPIPSAEWWGIWNQTLGRWLTEVGRLPPDVEVSGFPPDEIAAVGVTEDNADDLDRALTELVLNVSRFSADPRRTDRP
ncbi:MAG TPA: hypothetical protein VGO13_08030 [Solirubrobacterales bacterium]|jgi:hypothetical protein|nr:hypothetical protein [Solirubrobacterales bacterium]